jgi:hypothetical protein
MTRMARAQLSVRAVKVGAAEEEEEEEQEVVVVGESTLQRKFSITQAEAEAEAEEEEAAAAVRPDGGIEGSISQEALPLSPPPPPPPPHSSSSSSSGINASGQSPLKKLLGADGAAQRLGVDLPDLAADEMDNNGRESDSGASTSQQEGLALTAQRDDYNNNTLLPSWAADERAKRLAAEALLKEELRRREETEGEIAVLRRRLADSENAKVASHQEAVADLLTVNSGGSTGTGTGTAAAAAATEDGGAA